ncbi:hypothetical protein PV396_40735 [Streptomyces sp. ME02-8801-2C]|uniref:hypothetical protein n=1 Tax=Streptomyces sp. ME02-8801-2C TaxID=3028680 RepID=UPI0029B01DC9|nr:hypothetical protein [Streptomyces sp. ME02-8801-2C]MDX3458194.1 hypothetical protein [Streptomyces sp. ME02-8801-2C]
MQAEVAAIELEAGVGVDRDGPKAQAFGHHIRDPVRARGDVVDLDAGVVEVGIRQAVPLARAGDGYGLTGVGVPIADGAASPG